MGYQIASIVLKDGRKYDQAVIAGGIVRHAKWNFNEGSLS
jgi:hypothetical protein